MYDIGQGSNIKDKPQVFEIDLADTITDTICPGNVACSHPYSEIKQLDKHNFPTQYPLGYFDTSIDKALKEDYIDTSQHTKSGEPSDFILLAGAVVLVLLSVWFMLRKEKK